MVEDDELICGIVASILAPFGYTVIPVRDGDDALDALWEHGPDLAILDCALPGKTGLTILRDIRDSARFATLPVLILTARRSEWHAKLAAETGADDYVRKPFEAAELIAKIDALLANSLSQRDEAALLEQERVTFLTSVAGATGADDLLALFENDISARATEIADLLARGETALASKAAHALRGAADSVGALKLAGHCHAIERCDTTDSAPLAECATATIEAIAHARASLLPERKRA
jgi:DNA-binding response OmpR family regulator